jgi:hypothetical protein
MTEAAGILEPLPKLLRPARPLPEFATDSPLEEADSNLRFMISAATIAALEERKLEYILGARERSSAVVRRLVLEDDAPLTPLLVERVRGETQLFVKELKVGAARYVLCRNEAEAERERNQRQAIIAGLAKQLARGDKALIGNSAYRRYLRRTPSASGKPGDDRQCGAARRRALATPRGLLPLAGVTRDSLA